MFMQLLYIFMNFIFLTICEDELLSVVVVFRHGDRTPRSFYPNDPYQNKSNWPEGLGQLINKGKQRHYELGQWFRNRYKGFLSERYASDEIYIRSTDFDRTLMSAAANLAGLYPPQQDELWNEKILWQPIPIHTVPQENDNLLLVNYNCPRYKLLRTELDNSAYFQQFHLKNQDLYKYLQEHTGADIKTVVDVGTIYENLYVEDLLNLSLPEWTKSVYPNPIRYFGFLSFLLPTYTTELARLKTGLFWGELLKYFKNRNQTSNKTPKFLMYSAHDVTLTNLLNALESFEYHIPPYASTLIFEQRQNSKNQNYVTILYKNSNYNRLQKIRSRGCAFKCLITDFEENLKPITLTLEDWSNECHMEKKSVKEVPSKIA